jgi:hypothetical protein
MTITYTDANQFYAGIAQLVERGLTFDADANNLIITLTGGY